jgi:hypothetical protein
MGHGRNGIATSSCRSALALGAQAARAVYTASVLSHGFAAFRRAAAEHGEIEPIAEEGDLK